MNRPDILPPSAEMVIANHKEKKIGDAQETQLHYESIEESIPLHGEPFKLPSEQFFNPRSSWKTKILFAIEKLPGASLSEISDYLHRLEPDKSMDEILTYVTWYTFQMQNETGVTTVNTRNEEFYYWL